MEAPARRSVLLLMLIPMLAMTQPQDEPTSGDRRVSSVGLEFTWVPADTFKMGSDLEEATLDQRPVHEVELSEFWITVTEIPNEIYDRFDPGHAERTAPYTMSSGPRDPAVWVSWEEAQAFCVWLSEVENAPKGTFALPTEAQWERAAKGDDGRPYPWGTGITAVRLNLCDANCAFEALRNYAIDDGYVFVSPVDSFPAGASPFGCVNMAGNVREWCADWFDAEYYESAPREDPAGPKEGNLRSVRGGGYNYTALDCMTTSRDGVAPTERHIDIGFRVVRRP